jgi:amino acid adenylation domain-containing protein
LRAETPECREFEPVRPCGSTIVDLFEQQVARMPDAIAVACADRSLSYSELHRRSNQLARHLASLGVRNEMLVGIATERSIEMIIGLLAILKSGAAYVPIDPAYPAQRIALMIEDSEAPVILASERAKPRLPHCAMPVVALDGDVSTTAKYSSDSLPGMIDGKNLAYVIYTSGSTGRPKGVMIEHRNVVNFFHGMDQVIGSEPGVWLAVTSISFDISVLELFWTLTRGFKVIVHGDEGTHTIPEEIRKFGVTHMQATPSLVRMVATNPQGLAALGVLKKLLIGGEALPSSLVRQLRKEFCGELHNMYGPTETTIWSTTYKVDDEHDNIPIGTPIMNTSVYVLNSELRTVGAGEAGDLFIGGDGVVRGYWRRPELTAQNFLPDPFVPGSRMYRTGDLARFLPDGNLEFLGRADFQVKVRGFRIEIGEIEAAIEKQAEVNQAAVIAREFRPGDQRLIAYVVPRPGVNLRIDSLREALALQLPEYMVPALVVLMSKFPLTANGKIDRKALFETATTEDEGVPPPELPRNVMERLIAQAWKDALGVDHVGLDQNFFDLGAHSLMVAEVHIQLQQSLGREISLVDLFQFPTVGTLAGHLRGADAMPVTANRAERRLAARKQREQ